MFLGYILVFLPSTHRRGLFSMQPIPKEYNFAEIERKWQQKWEEMGIYQYNWNDKTRVPFSIDTPPPYPSGELHMGNVLNWTYFDIVARYKRMQGFNVLFPQGWDCHGLGIELSLIHISEPTRLGMISYAVFCLKKKKPETVTKPLSL